MSTVVIEKCNDFSEVTATETCLEVQSLILERLPLFTQKYSDTKPKAAIPSSTDHLKVRACKKILVSKTLATGNVRRTKDVWAIARYEGKHTEIWISTTAACNMFE